MIPLGRTTGYTGSHNQKHDKFRISKKNGRKPVKGIVFEGERFDVMSVRRWRDKGDGREDAAIGPWPTRPSAETKSWSAVPCHRFGRQLAASQMIGFKRHNTGLGTQSGG
jgi:hypothetical protein